MHFLSVLMSIIVRYTSIIPELINYRGISECFCTHTYTCMHTYNVTRHGMKNAQTNTEHREDFDETAIFNVFLQKIVYDSVYLCTVRYDASYFTFLLGFYKLYLYNNVKILQENFSTIKRI